MKKIYLSMSLCFSLGLLGFFKYFNFFIDSFQSLIGLFGVNTNTYMLHVVLPVGVSFYTFQSLSYTIDIYRNKLEPENDFISFLTFVSFFPQLVAGPIERASHLLGQFREKKNFNYDTSINGLRLILWGLFKKVVIADNLGQLVDYIFDPKNIPSGGILLVGGVMFAFQIYCDFSGYSDMATGLARMLGFNIMRNFMRPYGSASMTEFWRRWHISLSTWFRDYVYIPLGGNEKGSFRTKLNLVITFLLSGLWHGAKVTFLIWGLAHGLILVIEKTVKLKLNNFIRVPYIFLLTAILWIPFRAESYKHLKKLTFAVGNFDGFFMGLTNLQTVLPFYKIIFLSILFVCFLLIERNINILNFDEWLQKKSKVQRFSVYYFLTFSILLMANLNIKPNFIYFQF